MPAMEIEAAQKSRLPIGGGANTGEEIGSAQFDRGFLRVMEGSIQIRVSNG
jgi:hypothetical protein